MKIGIDIRNLGKNRTGDEVVFLNLVKNLAEIDSQNEYLLFTDTKDAEVLQYTVKNLGIENKKNFQIISLPTANKFTWNAWILPRYFKKNPVDIYHTQYILPFFISKKIKMITHIHDVSFMAYPEMIKKSDLFFLKNLIPWSLKRADKIIAVSEFTKDEVIKYFKTPAEKIAVVYNAIGDNFYQEISGEKLEAVRKKYNLPEKFILYIGTLQPRKNLPVLIEAFASLRKGISYNKLVLCGNREAHNFDKKIGAVIEKNNLKDATIFPGFIDEVDKPALYKLANIFCFPSSYEGFGIPLLEAMVTGTPVIASDIPPHREIAGSASIFFNPESSDDLSQKMALIAENGQLAADLVASGLDQIKHFSWKISAEKILDIYKKFG